jgi:hypothetical protein
VNDHNEDFVYSFTIASVPSDGRPEVSVVRAQLIVFNDLLGTFPEISQQCARPLHFVKADFPLASGSGMWIIAWISWPTV